MHTQTAWLRCKGLGFRHGQVKFQTHWCAPCKPWLAVLLHGTCLQQAAPCCTHWSLCGFAETHQPTHQSKHPFGQLDQPVDRQCCFPSLEVADTQLNVCWLFQDDGSFMKSGFAAEAQRVAQNLAAAAAGGFGATPLPGDHLCLGLDVHHLLA